MSWITAVIWPMVREIGEEKAKAEVRNLVREANEEVQQWLADEGAAELAELLKSVPEEMRPLIAAGVIEFVTRAAREPLQKAVNEAWAEVEKINPGDRPDAPPVVDFGAEE